MSIRFRILFVVLFGSLITYLASLNSSAVRVFLTPSVQLELPLWALLFGVSFVSILGTALVTLLRDTARAFHGRKAGPEAHDLTGISSLARTDQGSRELGENPAVLHYTEGKKALEAGDPREALRHMKEALRADKLFAPAHIAIGEAYEQMGERKDVVRAWERGAELVPSVPILRRLEEINRAEGRPSQMIQLYQDAIARAPHDQALAFHLGRVYFELSMLDDAVDQFRKIEVSLPHLPQLHAYLGAIYERRGQIRQACDEYSKALGLGALFEWPYTCATCGATATAWQDRCASCRQWNSLRP